MVGNTVTMEGPHVYPLPYRYALHEYIHKYISVLLPFQLDGGLRVSLQWLLPSGLEHMLFSICISNQSSKTPSIEASLSQAFTVCNALLTKASL